MYNAINIFDQMMGLWLRSVLFYYIVHTRAKGPWIKTLPSGVGKPRKSNHPKPNTTDMQTTNQGQYTTYYYIHGPMKPNTYNIHHITPKQT